MKFVKRSQWGARPPRYALAYIASTRGVKIHYEGTHVPASLADKDNHSQCDDRVRAIQTSHLNNKAEGYSDIAYNLLVCPHGYVYEGRGAHHKTGANGSQALNGRDYAVCALLGSSGLITPPDAMLEGLRDAIEYLRDKGDAGNWIGGHRDGYATACPGPKLYAWVEKGAPRPGGSASHTQASTAGGSAPKKPKKETPPKTQKRPKPYSPPSMPKGLAPGKSKPSAKPLQRALKEAGFMANSVEESANYGPKTQNAVAKFHDRYPKYRAEGVSHDPAIGAKGWAHLFTLAYGD